MRLNEQQSLRLPRFTLRNPPDIPEPTTKRRSQSRSATSVEAVARDAAHVGARIAQRPPLAPRRYARDCDVPSVDDRNRPTIVVASSVANVCSIVDNDCPRAFAFAFVVVVVA